VKKKIWKIKSISRHIHFSWRILLAKLPVKKDPFKKKKAAIHYVFFVRNIYNETISHLFMQCHWSKHIWFASSLGVVFNLNDSKYVRFQEWLERNIIDDDEDIIVYVLAFVLRDMMC